MHAATLERLASIVKRELDAQDVHVIQAVHVDSDVESAENGATITSDLGRGRKLVVTFSTPPTDRQAKLEHLAALITSFADLFAEAAPELPRSRPEPNLALQSELNALAGRAHAACALIIDAKSPVVWSASEAPTNADDLPISAQQHDAFEHARQLGISWRDLLTRPAGSLARGERKEHKSNNDSGRALRLVPPIDELAGLSPNEREIIARHAELARNAITRIHAHPILPQLHRGEHLHEAIREESFGYLARSFATIYVLILVFPGPFDELGAERAVTRALPIIERLVISLPPDDSPNTRKGAVVAMRPRRR